MRGVRIDRHVKVRRRWQLANRKRLSEYERIRSAQKKALEDFFYPNEPAASAKERDERRSALLAAAREMGLI
jgi:hypothetical protein